MLKLLLIISTIDVVLNIILSWITTNKIDKTDCIITVIFWLIIGTIAFIFI